MAFEQGLFRFPEGVDYSRYIFATYYLETPLEPHQAAEVLASEQSTGTWMRVKYETEERREKYGAKVVGVHPLPHDSGQCHLPTKVALSGKINAAVVRIGFPTINFSPNLTDLLSTVVGEAYELESFTALKLLDIELPTSFTQYFAGPKFGVDGLRSILDVYDRPLIGAVVKPCVGLSPEETAELAYQGAKGGLDFIKDDELLADAAYNPVRERVRAVTAALKRAEEETGEKTIYAFNISDRPSRLRELHDIVVENGGGCIMVNAAALGYESLRELSEFTEVPIFAHRVFASASIRSPYLGMSLEVLNKLLRLGGADMILVGAIGGKVYGSDAEVVASARACNQAFHHLKRSVPASSGGQWAGKLAGNVAAFGHVDFLHLSGGGVFGHPMNAEAGARSLRQAWDAYSKGVSVEEYAREHLELRAALRHFGG
jgi:ribulose-bisphosphate carboxylase large chain